MTTLEQISKKFEVPMKDVKKINDAFAMSMYNYYVEKKAMALPPYIEERAMALTYDYVEKWGCDGILFFQEGEK